MNNFVFPTDLVEKLLVHPHAWVKLQASQLFGLLFAAYPVDQLIDIINSSQSRESHYLAKDIVSKVEYNNYTFFDGLFLIFIFVVII